MSVGLPGSGIGGVFYLMSALWMPMDSVQREVRGDVPKWKLVMRQTVIALLIIAALWFTGVIIDWILAGAPMGSAVRSAIGAGDQASLPHVFRAASFGLTFGTLALVLGMVQVLRMFVRAPLPPADKPVTSIERKAA